MTPFFYKSNIEFEATLCEYEGMEDEYISQQIKLISNDPVVLFSDAKVENVINVTVIYVTVLTFKMPI